MSNTEPPTGAVPPDPEVPPTSATPPPPPPPPPAASVPPPPPPAASAPSPVAGYGAPPPQAIGIPRPGELLDRFLARLIDGIIIGIVAFIITAILAVISDSYVLGTFISAIVTAAIYLGYFGYLESSRGQTVGKQLMKLRVFGPDGRSNPTMQEAIKRNLWLGASILGILGAIGSFLGALIELAAVIVCAVNINGNLPDRRTWFDTFAGGTQVMKIG